MEVSEAEEVPSVSHNWTRCFTDGPTYIHLQEDSGECLTMDDNGDFPDTPCME